jgi:hypothetical protein
VLKPGQYGSPGIYVLHSKLKGRFLVKNLIALSLVACMLAVCTIGCGGDTKSTSKPAGSGAAAGADKDKKDK